jgi:hypothetical protein
MTGAEAGARDPQGTHPTICAPTVLVCRTPAEPCLNFSETRLSRSVRSTLRSNKRYPSTASPQKHSVSQQQHGFSVLLFDSVTT